MADISADRAASLQSRLNLIVFVLTFVSVASTVAAIITLEDISLVVDPPTRGLILGLVTLGVGVFCVAVIVTDTSCLRRIIHPFRRVGAFKTQRDVALKKGSATPAIIADDPGAISAGIRVKLDN